MAIELTIMRHCVASDSVTRLSPLQQALLDDPRRIRIASAPTGAGKSYAFLQAVAQREQRVLFIVPTRRLAQNLAAGFINDLVKERGWPSVRAETKVAVWSSDQSLELRSQQVEHISGYRLRQMQALNDTREGGEIIFAIPEVVSYLLLQRRIETGQAGLGIFDALNAFDHLVFDEFHTIEAQGFGLAALCARLASIPFGRARVSFLSATPLSIRPLLERLGIAATDIAELEESVSDTGRSLHGDVVLSLSKAPSLVGLVTEQKAAVAIEIAAGRQVVLIYNALANLRRELTVLATLCDDVGIPRDQVLVVNSIDDSRPEGATRLGFHVGRKQNPDDFSVLIATASVEMGVTFRAANLLFMEPGFSPLGFLQRYGRAARRGEDGRVWVRADEAMWKQQPWIRELREWATAREGQPTSITALTDLLSREAREHFKAGDSEQPRYFGQLPNRAVFTTGLYWNALLRHKSNKGPRREHLLQHQPASARTIYVLLQTVRKMEKDRLYAASAKAWCDRFEQLAYTLRDIGRRIRVIEGDGNLVEVPQIWLQRETTILEHGIHQIGRDDKEEIHISGELDDYLRDAAERKRVQRMMTVLFPHTSNQAHLPVNGELVAAWQRNLRGRQGIEGMAWEDFPEAMEAADKLVGMTGLVPGDDDDLSLDTNSSVL
ncbi:MAG TPA: DEAD/DEAH box helicase [Candidatus Contendobacter sp.]|nr:DEAD/DEAH box helicase [Candidatus Contendobacter sp.]